MPRIYLCKDFWDQSRKYSILHNAICNGDRMLFLVLVCLWNTNYFIHFVSKNNEKMVKDMEEQQILCCQKICQREIQKTSFECTVIQTSFFHCTSST